MKNGELGRQYEALLRDLVERVPFLELQSLRREASVGSSTYPDLVAELKAGRRPCTWVVECKKQAQPREVRTGLLQLERSLSTLPGNAPRYGVLLAPFISEESARLCADAKIGYADLAGNARLSFDHVFIETRVAENPFREKRDAQSLFAPRAARVLRVLLQGPLRGWKVAELAESARVSLGLVSAVRQQLLAREWAANGPDGLHVVKPKAVLEAWTSADDWERRTQTQEYSLLLTGDPVQVAEKLRDALPGAPPVFTQWFAGWLRHPHTIPPVVTAYVKEFPEEAVIEEKLLGRRVESGGRLRLAVPREEGVLHPAQTVRGFLLVSDVQLYLDLKHAGQRGEEQAEELRKWPDFAGGWGE
jgi:hypothetical protein